MRLLLVKLLGFSFLAFSIGCASAPTSDSVDSKVNLSESIIGSALKGKKKEGEQDVQSVDKQYSSRITAGSLSKKMKSKVNCLDYSKIKKENWRSLLEAGWSCIDTKNWSALSSIATTLSHRHIKAPWGPYYKSIIAEKKGDLTQSEWMISLAAKKAPENSIVLFQQARILWLQKSETESFNLMKKVTKLDPSNVDAHEFLGLIHYRDRQFKEAIEHLSKTLTFSSQKGPVQAALGESYYELKKYEKSLSHYKAAIRVLPSNADLWMKMGLAYKELNRFEDAKRSLTQAIKQKRQGRFVASLPDDEIRKHLKFIDKKLSEGKENAKK